MRKFFVIVVLTLLGAVAAESAAEAGLFRNRCGGHGRARAQRSRSCG